MVDLLSALEGGPYVHKYRAAQFHFHWGRTSQEGAEHLVDGKAYSAEVSSGQLITAFTPVLPVTSAAPLCNSSV